MSELNHIEELKKRKEQLLLEQEVARLERRQKIGKAGGWSWKWVAPVAAVGAYCFIGGMAEGNGAAIVIGILALTPVGMKLYFKSSD